MRAFSLSKALVSEEQTSLTSIPSLILQDKLSLVLCVVCIINLKYSKLLKFTEKRAIGIHWFIFHGKKPKLKYEAVQCVIFPKWLLFLDEKKFYWSGNFEPHLLNSIAVSQLSKYPVNFNLDHFKNYHDSKGSALKVETLVLRMQWIHHTGFGGKCQK